MGGNIENVWLCTLYVAHSGSNYTTELSISTFDNSTSLQQQMEIGNGVLIDKGNSSCPSLTFEGAGTLSVACKIYINDALFADSGSVYAGHGTIFANITGCTSAQEGLLAAITNSTTQTFGATISGGGTYHVLGYCDGTQWSVAAQ
jgi:hypothetical protein